MSVNSISEQDGTILILQGGGALGAYESGAFNVIAPRLDPTKELVVAGTSIGAVNACIIASAYQKEMLNEKPMERVAEDLKQFWLKEMPNPSLSTFFPSANPFVEIWQRYLNLWVTMLWGNQHMFTLDPLTTTNPLAPHHYDMHALENTLREHFLTCTGEEFYRKGRKPRLIVAAVEVQEGHMKTFDSDKEDITPEKVVACCSIAPFGMPAKEVDGKYYWDGGLWSNTPLEAVLHTLQPSNGDKQQPEDKVPEYQVYLINDHPHQGPLPQDFLGVQERTLDIMLADKSDYDIKVSEWVNRYILLAQRFKHWAHRVHLEPEDVKEIDAAYNKEVAGKKILHFVPLRRGGLPYDYWSATGDFSLSRIKELIAQGEREIQQQLEDLDTRQQEHDTWQQEYNALQKEYDTLKQTQRSPKVAGPASTVMAQPAGEVTPKASN